MYAVCNLSGLGVLLRFIALGVWVLQNKAPGE